MVPGGLQKTPSKNIYKKYKKININRKIAYLGGPKKWGTNGGRTDFWSLLWLRAPLGHPWGSHWGGSGEVLGRSWGGRVVDPTEPPGISTVATLVRQTYDGEATGSTQGTGLADRTPVSQTSELVRWS